MNEAVRIVKVNRGYIVSSAVQAPGDETVFVTFEAVIAYLRERFKEEAQ